MYIIYIKIIFNKKNKNTLLWENNKNDADQHIDQWVEGPEWWKKPDNELFSPSFMSYMKDTILESWLSTQERQLKINEQKYYMWKLCTNEEIWKYIFSMTWLSPESKLGKEIGKKIETVSESLTVIESERNEMISEELKNRENTWNNQILEKIENTRSNLSHFVEKLEEEFPDRNSEIELIKSLTTTLLKDPESIIENHSTYNLLKLSEHDDRRILWLQKRKVINVLTKLKSSQLDNLLKELDHNIDLLARLISANEGHQYTEEFEVDTIQDIEKKSEKICNRYKWFMKENIINNPWVTLDLRDQIWTDINNRQSTIINKFTPQWMFFHSQLLEPLIVKVLDHQFKEFGFEFMHTSMLDDVYGWVDAIGDYHKNWIAYRWYIDFKFGEEQWSDDKKPLYDIYIREITSSKDYTWESIILDNQELEEEENHIFPKEIITLRLNKHLFNQILAKVLEEAGNINQNNGFESFDDYQKFMNEILSKPSIADLINDACIEDTVLNTITNNNFRNKGFKKTHKNKLTLITKYLPW